MAACRTVCRALLDQCHAVGRNADPLQLFGHAFEISEQGLALLCLPLLWCYHGRQGAHNRKIQLACYAFYPVHMLVLGILSKLIFS